MINISEDLWWDTFEEYSIKFGEVRPDYKKLKPEEAEIGALFNMELDMHNGGFLQFFCNWGYEAYIYALRGLLVDTNAVIRRQKPYLMEAIPLRSMRPTMMEMRLRRRP